MPLARMAIYASGAQILVSATWDKSPEWLQSVQHIAREGGLFVLSACMALRMSDIPEEYGFKKLYAAGREWINPGNSCILSPKGKFLAGPLEKEEGLLFAELDLREILAAKRLFDVVGHYSRPDVFQFSALPQGGR
jgi:nitrilase